MQNRPKRPNKKHFLLEQNTRLLLTELLAQDFRNSLSLASAASMATQGR